jgi:hypothetical protein
MLEKLSWAAKLLLFLLPDGLLYDNNVYYVLPVCEMLFEAYVIIGKKLIY